jgi:hypothetical protein
MCGPKKVVCNLIESLEQEKVPYSINEDVYDYNFLLQYDAIGYQKHENLEHESCVIGPQFWPFDGDIYGNFLIDNPQYYKKLIAPSYWVKDLLVDKFKLPENKVSIWPVGIKDLSGIKNETSTTDCLIYFKSRSEEDLEFVKNFLNYKRITYKVIGYGSYSEEEFYEELSKVKFCFILNHTESQGIAIQEMMSANIPLLVWDVPYWDHKGEEYKLPSSSVPYWNSECGEKFYTAFDIESTFEKFYDKMEQYSSRKIYDTELSYKVTVEKILKIFEE